MVSAQSKCEKVEQKHTQKTALSDAIRGCKYHTHMACHDQTFFATRGTCHAGVAARENLRLASKPAGREFLAEPCLELTLSQLFSKSQFGPLN